MAQTTREDQQRAAAQRAPGQSAAQNAAGGQLNGDSADPQNNRGTASGGDRGNQPGVDRTARNQNTDQNGTQSLPGGTGANTGANAMLARFPLMMMLDIDQNGELSPAEIDSAVASIKRLDRNSDGRITSDELMPQSMPNSDSTAGNGNPEMNEMVSRILDADANGDGFIDKQETPFQMRPVFGRADLDNDGQLSRDEISKILLLQMNRSAAAGTGPRSATAAAAAAGANVPRPTPGVNVPGTGVTPPALSPLNGNGLRNASGVGAAAGAGAANNGVNGTAGAGVGAGVTPPVLSPLNGNGLRNAAGAGAAGAGAAGGAAAGGAGGSGGAGAAGGGGSPK